MRQIFPSASGTGEGLDVDLDALYGAARPRRPGRPWVAVCMITGIDGSTVVDGASGGLGNDGDRAVFSALRRAADVIIVGAGTATAEGYGPPGRAEQRIGVVTASGRVDTSTELFRSGAGFLITTEDESGSHEGVDVVRAGTGSVDLDLALARLEPVVGPVRFVQAEGGPRLNGSLAAADVIDEINWSIAPLLTGGDGSRLTVGAPEQMRRFRPVHVLTDEAGYLFTQWRRHDATGEADGRSVAVSPAAP
ncbi:dihydrofolate reductase family protein [Desertimonas flava]|uniref:dihydrofolate reductase family protein n=1 Tax=Desertimonas flava TaxID=2064846 RepID=UPI0013C47454|nr:dihydrofolate reductase family protein [Desertimonas flava]